MEIFNYLLPNLRRAKRAKLLLDRDSFEVTPSDFNSTNAFWNGLTKAQQQSILDNYTDENNGIVNLWGLLGDIEELDTDSLLRDLANTQQMFDDYAALGDQPVYETYLQDARDKIAAENAEMYADLDKLLSTQTDLYNDQIADISRDYDALRSNLMSQQYRQNSQLMDTLQSGMERSRRNALEAGASAGVRIADNINTLLSVQNKQSATSMETANQLSQMMINQRNAESSARRSYADYLAEDTANRHDIKLGSEGRATSLAGTNYDSAYNSYTAKETALDNKYGLDNPFYDYRKMGSKYSTNTGANTTTNKYSQ